MKLELDHINKLLDDYVIAVDKYHALKDRLKGTDDEASKNQLDDYQQAIHEKRKEIDNYFIKVHNITSSNSIEFQQMDLIETINNLSEIMKNDLANLERHKKDDPAVFLLDNYRHHLIYLVMKYGKKINK